MPPNCITVCHANTSYLVISSCTLVSNSIPRRHPNPAPRIVFFSCAFTNPKKKPTNNNANRSESTGEMHPFGAELDSSQNVNHFVPCSPNPKPLRHVGLDDAIA